MPRVKLSEIVNVLDMPTEEMHAILDKQAGEVVVFTREELDAAETEEDLADYPEWERKQIELAKAVQADDGQRFPALPDRFDFDEWDMMRDFAEGLDNEEHSAALLNAIQGRGAFRYFKDRAHELGLADAWYKFRDGEYRRIALDWCQAHDVDVDPAA